MSDDESKALATRPTGDLYERKFMSGDAPVLYRDRMVAGKKFNLFLVAIAAFAVGYPALMGAPIAATLPALPILAMVWIFFGVLRTTVSSETLKIQHGLFGPTIPIASIESAQAIDYDWKAFGGWGIRRGKEGWMYNMMGDGGRAVRIKWRDAKGKSKVTFVGTRTADQLAAAIDQARTALPPAEAQAALEAADE